VFSFVLISTDGWLLSMIFPLYLLCSPVIKNYQLIKSKILIYGIKEVIWVITTPFYDYDVTITVLICILNSCQINMSDLSMPSGG